MVSLYLDRLYQALWLVNELAIRKQYDKKIYAFEKWLLFCNTANIGNWCPPLLSANYFRMCKSGVHRNGHDRSMYNQDKTQSCYYILLIYTKMNFPFVTYISNLLGAIYAKKCCVKVEPEKLYKAFPLVIFRIFGCHPMIGWQTVNFFLIGC